MEATAFGWIAVSALKGGMGCSTATAGLAMELARVGRRVLLVDWNLKQPSLHRFLNVDEGSLRECPGVAGYLAASSVEETGNSPTHPLSYIVRPIPLPDGIEGSIDLMPAGTLGRDYWNFVLGFSWDRFYEEQQGYLAIERLRHGALEGYDAILVDAGFLRDDGANIAVIQLSDVAVLVFQADAVTATATLNAADQIGRHPFRVERGRPPVRCIVTPARIDRTTDRFTDWLHSDVVRKLLAPFGQSHEPAVLERRALGLEPSLSIGQIDVRSPAFAELERLRSSFQQILSEIG